MKLAEVVRTALDGVVDPGILVRSKKVRNVAELYISLLDPDGKHNILKDALLSAIRRLRKSSRTEGWEDVVHPMPDTAEEAIAAASRPKVTTPTLVIKFLTDLDMANAAVEIASAWRRTMDELPEGLVDMETVVSKLLPRLRPGMFGNVPPTFCMSNVPTTARQAALIVGSAGDGEEYAFGQGFQGCNFCGKSAKKVSICSKCMDVGYCGPECQRAGWEGHKPHCAAFTRLTDKVAMCLAEAGLTCRRS